MLGADELLAAIGDWLGVLHDLARAAERHAGLAVVLDEFSYLADTDPALHPEVLGLRSGPRRKPEAAAVRIDHFPDAGAARGAQSALRSQDPGARPRSAAPSGRSAVRSTEDRLAAFGVFGGMPFDLQFLDPGAPLHSNILRLLLSATGSLVDEPMVLLQSRLREVSRYASVLAAIAAGCTQHGEIIGRVREISDSKALGPYLEKLDRMRLIRIERSMDAHPRARNRRYFIADPLIAF